MSQSPRLSSRVSSDFSIERILSEDSAKKNREILRITNEEFSCSSERSQNVRDVSSNLSILPNSNVDTCSRLQFSNVDEINSYDTRTFFPRYTEVLSRSSEATTVSTSLVESGNTEDTRRFKLEDSSELSWLQCTRYRPPKLPRKSTIGKTGKRRPGAHPRIPFTTLQLQILEDKYRSTAYLSRRDVLQLSTTLRLPQSRVKIWFQNRRARDRRETCVSGSNITTIITGDSSSAHKTPNSSIEKSPSKNPS